MPHLNAFALSGLLITVAYTPLLFFLLLKAKTKLIRIYTLHIFAVLMWGLGCAWVATTSDATLVLHRWKFAYINVLMIPVFFYHSVHILTNNQNRLILKVIYGQLAFFIYIILNNQMFLSHRFVYGEFYIFNNSRFYLASFLAWEIIVLLAHLDLIHFLKNQNKHKKDAILALIFAGVGFIGGTNNFLTGLNIDIYPYGNFLIPLHSFGVTYAILKHKLFDIEVTLKRSIAYSMLFSCLTLLYLLSVLLSEKAIQYFFNYTSPINSIIIAFVIGLIFIPFRNIIQRMIDKLLFNKTGLEIITENERLLKELSQTEKLKSIALFASGMAHEIKNPLTSIKTLCAYLPQKLNDKEFIDKFIPLVNKDVERIDELVHDLLDYSKPTKPDKQDTDIHKLLENIVHSLSSQIVQNKIKIDFNLERTNIQTIQIDPKQIKQALLNIILNALESMKSGGTLLIETSLSSDLEKLYITISDSGCGIVKEDLPLIFDPFFTKKEHGTGLGLSITHGIIKEHGGKIFVDSAVGKGTTFRIELPFRKQT